MRNGLIIINKLTKETNFKDDTVCETRKEESIREYFYLDKELELKTRRYKNELR